MYYRCDLSVDGYSYDVTNDIRNWDDIKSSIKRSDFDGAVRSFTNQFEFTNNAYVLLLNEYRKNLLGFSAMIIFYTRTNSWEWKEEFRKKLDVSTLTYDGSTLSVNAIDDGVSAIIKSKRGTQYEYSVKNYAEKTKLEYDGIVMENTVNWTIVGESDLDDGTPVISMPSSQEQIYFPLFLAKEDVSVNNLFIYTDSGIGEFYGRLGDTNSPIVECIKDGTFYLNADFNLPIIGAAYSFSIKKYTKTNVPINEVTFAIRIPESEDFALSKSVKIENLKVDMKAEERILAIITLKNNKAERRFPITGKRTFDIKWNDRINKITIDVIKPVTLLNCLLKSMNSGKEGISGEIDESYDSRISSCLLLSAESIRGINGAKMYASFSKFCDWIKSVFGYVYYIDGSVIKFVHRSKLFDSKVIKTIENATNFNYTANKALIYSQVNVGYDKQDYDSANGRYEWNFTNYYTTGVTLNDSKYELKSPFRADCYGIEFLADVRGKDTTDNTSDNDMFFLMASISKSYYKILHNYSIEGVPEGCFNGEFSPIFCIKANEGYIGAFAKNLVYASSDGNTDVLINNENVNKDMNIGNGLFTIGNIEFETDEIDIPENWNGVVELTHDGINYKGFISSVDVAYTKEEATTYNLIEKEIV